MVAIRRGDVVLCDLNPVVGTEQAGIRPAVVELKAASREWRRRNPAKVDA